MTGELRVCLIQFDIKTNSPAYNLTKVLTSAKKAIEVKNAEIICFPELFTTGFGNLEDIENHSEVLEDSPTLSRIEEFSETYQVITCGSLPEKDGNKLHNTAFIIENGKLLGTYRKKNLFVPFREDDFFSPGSNITIVQTSKIKIGLQLCYDIRFPEVSRELALNGAELILVPANFPDPREDIWLILLQARAIENQLFVVGINRTGSDEQNTFFGHSIAIQPDGKLLTPLARDESVLTAILDLNLIKETRNQIPAFKEFQNQFRNKKR
ncbi:MAG: nitrilase-related carbon-nitrogen hydrolase [Candidatus Hodarchaeales archaeon]|jgi:predicted amidohydrolase